MASKRGVRRRKSTPTKQFVLTDDEMCFLYFTVRDQTVFSSRRDATIRKRFLRKYRAIKIELNSSNMFK